MTTTDQSGERCEVCDRAECERARRSAASPAMSTDEQVRAAYRACRARAVDWRAEALRLRTDLAALTERLAKAEQERDSAKRAQLMAVNTVHEREAQVSRYQQWLGEANADVAAARELAVWATLHLSRIAAAIGLTTDEQSGSNPEHVLSRVVDIVANRAWLLDEHVPALTADLATARAEVERMRLFLVHIAEADPDSRLGAVKLYDRPGRPHPEYSAEWIQDAARHVLGLPDPEETCNE